MTEVEEERHRSSGGVTLVGAGPGDVGSLTFAATRALQGADLVVYDADVPAETVNLARREARKIAPESEIEAATFLLDEAQKGIWAVWLGTGDPTIACIGTAEPQNWIDTARRRAPVSLGSDGAPLSWAVPDVNNPSNYGSPCYSNGNFGHLQKTVAGMPPFSPRLRG